MAVNEVFSEFELEELGFRVDDDASATTSTCLGSMEYSIERKKVTKECGGRTVKVRTRNTGHGTIKISGHLPYAVYVEMAGLVSSDLKENVYGNEEGTVLPKACLTAKINDEDGNSMLMAFPQVTITADETKKITNGDETVAELEMELEYFPDSNGFGFYKVREDEMPSTVTEETWMSAFAATMVLAS